MSEITHDQLLASMLPDVAFDGWSRHSMIAAGKRLGLDAAGVDALYPGGPRDLVAAFSRWADRRMLELLAERDLGAMRVHERVEAGVIARLDVLAPHREAVRRALSLLTMPQNAALATRLLYETVNAIWYAAGDTATDFNFYTKRGLLAPAYAATTLYWLDDRSPGQEATRAFLRRALANIGRLPKLGAELKARLGWLPNPLRLVRVAQASKLRGRRV